MKIACLFKTGSVARLIAAHMEGADDDIEPYADVFAVLRAARRGCLDAVLVEDIEGDIEDWLSILRLRLAQQTAIVVVGNRVEAGAAKAFAGGACDYIAVEHANEVRVRLTAHVTARRIQHQSTLEVGGYVLRRDTLTVNCNGRDICLTQREFELAWVLFSSPGKVIALSHLAARVWGHAADVSKRTIEQHVYKLRLKLGLANRPGSRIQAAYGIGYRLEIGELVTLPYEEVGVAATPEGHLQAAQATPDAYGWI